MSTAQRHEVQSSGSPGGLLGPGRVSRGIGSDGIQTHPEGDYDLRLGPEHGVLW